MVFEKVLSTINKHNLIEPGDKIVIGISGGPDSVCLLHILSRLKEKIDIELYAAHLNHQIRGLEAQKDALYVSNICDELGVTYAILDSSESINKWNNKQLDVGLIHPASAGHGLNLQDGGSTLVWFGLT